MWEPLLKRYWQVSLLKQTPENTPYSPFLLVSVAVFFSLLMIVQWYIADINQQFTLPMSLLAAFALVASYALYTYALLAAYRIANRTIQTLTCLLACHSIVHLFAFPLLLLTPALAQANMKDPFILLVGIVYLILTLGLTIWQFLITVHIYRHALTTNNLRAVLASFGLMAFNILIISFWR